MTTRRQSPRGRAAMMLREYLGTDCAAELIERVADVKVRAALATVAERLREIGDDEREQAQLGGCVSAACAISVPTVR